VSTQQNNTAENLDFTPGQASGQHQDAVAVDGLEHIFKWASEVVSDPEDERVRQARDRRVRRQVLDVVQKYREQRVLSKSQDEVTYLQRRVIALLSKLQELTEENAAVKQIMVSQYWAVQRIPALEEQVRSLKMVEFEKEAAIKERRYLMDALAKLKVERDYLEDILTTCEDENTRLSGILKETRAELTTLKAKKWWHFFVPESMRK
jgi:chromosome segregation ATPase